MLYYSALTRGCRCPRLFALPPSPVCCLPGRTVRVLPTGVLSGCSQGCYCQGAPKGVKGGIVRVLPRALRAALSGCSQGRYCQGTPKGCWPDPLREAFPWRWGSTIQLQAGSSTKTGFTAMAYCYSYSYGLLLQLQLGFTATAYCSTKEMIRLLN